MAPDDRDPGITLRRLVEVFPGARVALWCNACPSVQKFDIERVVEKLTAEGVDGWALGIRALAWRVKAPCPVCGKMAWETRPDYPPAAMGLR